MPLRCLHRQHAATYKLTDDIYACMSLQKQLKPASFYIVPRWVQDGTAMTISAMTAICLIEFSFLMVWSLWPWGNLATSQLEHDWHIDDRKQVQHILVVQSSLSVWSGHRDMLHLHLPQVPQILHTNSPVKFYIMVANYSNIKTNVEGLWWWHSRFWWLHCGDGVAAPNKQLNSCDSLA